MSAAPATVAGAGALAGASAVPGLNALLLPLLLSFGPGILSKLFAGTSPQEDYRKQVAQLYSPENLAALSDKFYQTNISSPAFSQGQSAIAAGANQTANQVASRLASSGISGSGTGAILNSLTPSLIGHDQAQLRTQAYTAAQGSAQDTVAKQLAALTSTWGQHSPTQQLLGGGVDSFTPYLTSWLKSRYPNMFQAGTQGNMVPNMFTTPK